MNRCKLFVGIIFSILLITSFVPSSYSLAPFVDPKKDPQHYVKRYFNEPKYKAWFDKNYGSKYKSIYEAVGIPEPTKSSIPDKPQKSIDPGIINDAFKKIQNQPDKFKGKWVKLAGKVSQDPLDYGDSGIWIIFDYNQGGSFNANSRVWLQTYRTDLDIVEGDCFVVEGKILGGADIVYQFTGAQTTIPLIGLEKIKTISCVEAQYPSYKSIEINQIQAIGNTQITIKKVEFTKWHTRIAISVENLGNPDGIVFSEYESAIIQDKRQFKTDYMFLEQDNIESEIPDGVIEDGIVVFKIIKPKPFRLHLEAYESGSFDKESFDFEIKP